MESSRQAVLALDLSDIKRRRAGLRGLQPISMAVESEPRTFHVLRKGTAPLAHLCCFSELTRLCGYHLVQLTSRVR